MARGPNRIRQCIGLLRMESMSIYGSGTAYVYAWVGPITSEIGILTCMMRVYDMSTDFCPSQETTTPGRFTASTSDHNNRGASPFQRQNQMKSKGISPGERIQMKINGSNK